MAMNSMAAGCVGVMSLSGQWKPIDAIFVNSVGHADGSDGSREAKLRVAPHPCAVTDECHVLQWMPPRASHPLPTNSGRKGSSSALLRSSQQTKLYSSSTHTSFVLETDGAITGPILTYLFPLTVFFAEVAVVCFFGNTQRCDKLNSLYTAWYCLVS